MSDVMDRLTEIFREIFDDERLDLRDETVAADVPEWDSLNHVKLVVAIEETFGLELSNREIAAWENVGDIRRSIAARISA